MRQYLKALQHVIDNGQVRKDRTGVGTKSVFGYQMRFDLSEGFPAVTTKKLAFKAMTSELLWFLEGSTDERRLAEILYEKPRAEITDKRTIWTDNADAQGVALGYANSVNRKELGPVYGSQWKSWGGMGIDQINALVDDLKSNPYSRRHILSAWNVQDIDKMALPPCHVMAQFYVMDVSGSRRFQNYLQTLDTKEQNKALEQTTERLVNETDYDRIDNIYDKYVDEVAPETARFSLSCQMYQRSADLLLGSPFNIASYALLTHMIAHVCGYEVGDFVYSLGDMHLYSNHIDQAVEQLTRQPLALPKLWLNPEVHNIEDFTMKDIALVDYQHQGIIKAKMAV